jgi:transcriptional regulator with XRE-family HTH domain
MEGGPPKTVAGQIRDARVRRNLTQDELARIIGTSRRVIIRWELGANRPGLKYQRLLSNALGLPPGCFNGTEVTDK